MKLLKPNLWVDSLHHIPLNKLQSLGIQGLLIDVDNTLLAWDAEEPTEEVQAWIRHARENGFQVVLVSNNKPARVEKMKNFFKVHGMARAKKPTTAALKKAMRHMKLKKNQLAIIGDQIFTDVLAGNRLGIYTILVTPIKSKEFWWTTLVRPVEGRVLKRMKKT